MLIYALALAQAAPMPLTDAHMRDIFCLVEIAILAEEVRQGMPHDPALPAMGKRWAGVVGDRITFETGQPREVVSKAMMETARARAAQIMVNDQSACIRQMTRELDALDAADAPLPSPVKAQ